MTPVPTSPKQRVHPKQRQRGVSLIELMVALVIGVVLAGAAVMIYANSKHGFVVQDNTASVQENGRFALHLLKEDIRLAGYWGLNYRPTTIGSVGAITLTNECIANWATDVTLPLGILNNTNATYTTCIPDTDYYDPDNDNVGSDVLTVRHASSEPVTTLVDGDVYLRTSLTNGLLFVWDASSPPDTDIGEVPADNHRLLAHAYYIRPFSTAGDGIPTLVREVIRGTAVAAEPLIEYVEDFQVTFGLDTNADGDVDRYDNDGIDAADIDNVMTIIVEILVRAPTPEADYTNTRTYQLGDRTHTPNDGFRRQAFRQTIFVRNGAGLGSV